MNDKDIKIKTEIEGILKNNLSGVKLKTYFEDMPDKKIRRAIHILAAIYPDKEIISDNNFLFIPYMLSNKKMLSQQSFPDFIRSLNLINFNEHQKSILVNTIKENLQALCEICTFELDDLLIKIFPKSDLFKYFEALIENCSNAVLWHISNILRYEDFSNISDEALENLKDHILSISIGSQAR